MELRLEVNCTFKQAADKLVSPSGTTVLYITPPVGEDYWLARVKLHRDQYMLAFPKFGTIGCGFAKERDWNTNLPLRLDAWSIYNHIKHNKRYNAISKEACLEAIRLLQSTCKGLLYDNKGV